jgi:ATP-dependent Clp protease ATP-binding subunit ClpA
VRKLRGGSFFEAASARILGQEKPLRAMSDKLESDALVARPHQPLRLLMEGQPGVGKSESAKVLAEHLGIPLVTIDAASLSDPHTAYSQLLGSGRGIVMSYKAGRLEDAVRQPSVIEIADLDHANPSVRSTLAEMFLRCLDEGRCETSSGDTFSTANSIFLFTTNLPGCHDYDKPMGFGETTREERRDRIEQDLRRIFSTAFLSRVGEPIVFNALTSDIFAEIAVRAIRSDLLGYFARNNRKAPALHVSPEVGREIAGGLSSIDRTRGARRIVDLSRTAAVDLLRRLPEFTENDNLVITPGKEGKPEIKVISKES